MVKPTIEDIQHSDLTPLERELALASFGAEALTVAQMEESLAALESAISDAHSAGQSRDETHDDANGNASGAHPAAAPASRESAAAQKRAPDPALASNPHLQAWRNRLNGLRERNQIARPLRACGRLTRAAGLVLEAVGLRLAVGSEVMIELPPGSTRTMAEAEVVGFHGDKLFLMPTTEVAGLLPGARVYPLEVAPIADPMAGAKRLPVGWELLGRVVDASGKPLDGFGPLNSRNDAPLTAPTINPLHREPIHKVLDVGVRAINALLTVGRGQRMGLFAGSGVGKSVLLGTMARYTSAEVIVIGLIGERGREVKEFIEQILGEEGLARSVVVAAPADVSPLLRMQAAAYTTSLAEYFRDQGKHVLLLMDSLTRYAMAQREIALAIGEPPATKGYPPSVFAKLPALVERTGNGPEGGGSITAFYTVLTEGDDQQDPIADSARAILDGHIVLSRALAEAGHYPAIDIEASISRAMTSLISDAHLDRTRQFKQMLSRYQRNRDLINVGAYSSGRDAVLDKAIALYPRMEAFLQQGFRESAGFDASIAHLDSLFG
ncbi:flagellar protein export ATPase FliI [Burkholderia sp. YR290]|uniref:Flagellum-specific ATP synthase n=1 Tax=Paraburkholderia hospita TaxID=169430 RepID=A0ABP2PYF0_9BURK|nr:flagellar protein export ATPase FliI [Paraburkholderia hospita]SKC64365.1 flagellar protein export ATPase FliI [Burkholderia sp. CF099]SOE61019.1 flagellar protein export ATPase FliI [Burkholderia sp. YR290]EIN02839.1 FliI/YscN family ATPase [Paraburkholderia hospita]OUL86342.1 flagellum-specific ATP synthase FliI [Paraburkholderia hospita]OUL87425.1 flagellum-specific ATP synthase FliI [Paraburkholderia hospita]